jgi:fatty acid desaturase
LSLSGGNVNDFLHGWLNYQIEHHMFADLSMLSYQATTHNTLTHPMTHINMP